MTTTAWIYSLHHQHAKHHGQPSVGEFRAELALLGLGVRRADGLPAIVTWLVTEMETLISDLNSSLCAK